MGFGYSGPVSSPPKSQSLMQWLQLKVGEQGEVIRHAVLRLPQQPMVFGGGPIVGLFDVALVLMPCAGFARKVRRRWVVLEVVEFGPV